MSILFHFLNWRGPFGAIQNLLKKSHMPKKIQMKNTKIAKGRSLVCFRGSGRRFCFGRSSDVSSMFWICVVQVEQMNKKSGPFSVMSVVWRKKGSL